MFPPPIIASMEGPLARTSRIGLVRKEAAMIVWTLHLQQQQCGAQVRQPGEAPREAVRGREGQDHEQAGGAPQPGESPASEIAHRDKDNTPSAPDDPRVEWDDVVQPQRTPGRQQRGESFDRLPLPEGK
jgi:hypothetical protein